MTNQLIGELIRFRQNSVAVMADIETMVHQVCVEEEYHDYLRFLSWPNGDITKEPVDFQMCVHLQGATSSPSCANYALRETAKTYKDEFGEDAANTFIRNFYVDDMLKSCPDSQSAIKMIPNVVKMSKAVISDLRNSIRRREIKTFEESGHVIKHPRGKSTWNELVSRVRQVFLQNLFEGEANHTKRNLINNQLNL